MADLVIRNGTIVDGTGAPPFPGDVAVTGSTITAVGDVEERGAREIDADGLLVTPGFVDIHTHFDGQVTWDPIVAPSSIHGVTTIAMGNCGVGFAPARVDRHDWLIGLLEGVEDIPGSALAEGLTWDWETFPEYLDALDAKPHTLDLAAHVPHAALRTYVMGDRGADHTEAPSDDELAQLAALVSEALEAGAIGFATSRTDVHRTKDGENIGTLSASARELLAIAAVLGSTGLGVTQLISDCYQTTDDAFADAELSLIEAFARTSGRPVSFTVQQAYHSPERWRKIFDRVAEMRAAGLDVKPQVAPRPIGVLLGLEATANPFLFTRSFDDIARLPLSERVAALRVPERRRRILEEHATMIAALPDGLFKQIAGGFDVMFELSDPVDYELDADWSFGARARAAGTDPAPLVYDALLEQEGRQLLYIPLFNFAHGNFDDIFEMISTPFSLFGLSDAGAHCGAICDASMTTSSLVVWARDRKRGTRLPVEQIVHQQTQRTAHHVGWLDRGVVAPGYLADLNTIDFDALGCRPPHLVYDLPAGGRRLMQEAVGYRMTIKAGTVTFEDGEATGALPGRLLRGTRPAPLKKGRGHERRAKRARSAEPGAAPSGGAEAMSGNELNWMQRYAASEVVEHAFTGEMSRRELLTRLVGICGSVTAAAAFLAACDDGSSSSTPSSTSKPRATPGSTAVTPATGAVSGGAALSVAVDDPDVDAQDVTFPGPAGDVFGYYAEPTAPGERAGVIVIHEIFGLSDHIRDVTRRVAKAGYLALAVDLASRAGGTDATTNVAGALTQGPVEERTADLDAGVQYLERQPKFNGKLGAVGFCFGGGMTLSFAAAQPKVRAAVPYYGPTPQPPSVMAATNAAILAQYGENDARVNASIPDLEQAMAGQTLETHIYPGAGHAFNNDTGGAYNEAVAIEAWTRTLEWFSQHLA